MKRLLFLAIFIFTTVFAFAQTQGAITPPVVDKKDTPKKKLIPKKDGYLSKEVTEADTVVPYSVIKDEDKAFVKRVWREIDLRDRGNSILASPKVNLLGVIYTALNNGELDMYAPDDEDFKGQPLNSSRGNSTTAGTGSAADTAFLGLNQNTNELNRADNEFFAASYSIIRIKEDWVLDIKRGIFEPRIVGIAPVRIDVKTPVDNNGVPLVDPVTNTVRGDTLKSVAGWFYFDDLREILVKTKIANNGNDNSGINFDDVFVRRLFYSNITKWSNAADNRIADYIANSKDRLIESERIKKWLSDFEQGLWEY
ncbi:type IX secretion system ring subunit PorN/GldN [Pedobacter insulae]|uniref:Gliding motility associated protien GldN n=1 Tax=Pedobacter insulae TaxID=414048 RepID=A0A1I2TGH4_9SPHI|nr:gliding motility protein GldN [Pedobacter insulae]SFG64010.1 gliding motility associated protien GldN [Pedobacter insulae]